MLLDRIAKFFKFAVNAILSKRRRERLGVEEDVDVFREALDQVPALGKTGAALEDDLVSGNAGDGAKRLGDVVVLFDEGRSQATGAEVLRRPEDGLLKIRSSKRRMSAIAFGLPVLRVEHPREDSEVKTRKRVQ